MASLTRCSLLVAIALVGCGGSTSSATGETSVGALGAGVGGAGGGVGDGGSGGASGQAGMSSAGGVGVAGKGAGGGMAGMGGGVSGSGGVAGSGGIGAAGMSGHGVGGLGGTNAAGSGGVAGSGGGSSGMGGASGSAGSLACSITHPMSTVCGFPSCPLLGIVDITCPEDNFGMGGLSVAQASESVSFVGVTSDYDHTHLFVLGNAEAELSAFPLQLDVEPLLLAVDPSGRPCAVGDQTHATGATYPGGLTYAALDPTGTWSSETVADSDMMYVAAADFEIAFDGTPHVWWASAPPDGWSMATRSPGGGWMSVDAYPAGAYGYYRFTLDDGGAPVSLGFSQEGAGLRLHALASGTDTALGPMTLYEYATFAPVARASSPVAAGPSYTAILEIDDGLHLVAPGTDVSIPATTAPVHSCPPGMFLPDPNAMCPAPCHDTADGIASHAWAAARTPDGSTYIAYVTQHVDRQLSYSATCSEGQCYCGSAVDSDATTATLHVLGVLPGGGIGGPFEMPIGIPVAIDGGETGKFIDARAWGTTLVVGVRIQTAGGIAARVITMDSTMIGGPGLRARGA